MTREQFLNHGWKSTDQLEYSYIDRDGNDKTIIVPIIVVGFSVFSFIVKMPIERHRRYPFDGTVDLNSTYEHQLEIDEVELYQPVHEAHTSLLTNPS